MNVMACQTVGNAYFFDLSSYPHSVLFKASNFPWEALLQISPYLQAQPLGEILGTISPQAYLVKPELISIGVGTIVEPGAYIEGPCIIGNNCIVRHGAYIRGNLITGDRCVIGHDTEVKNSIFLNGVHAAHFAYVGDSILGHRVNLGAGVKLANLKLNHGVVSVQLEGERIATGLKKLGAIIGDDTQIGCNTVTNPGILIGQGVQCYPCMNMGGFIPSHSSAKADTRIVISPLCQ